MTPYCSRLKQYLEDNLKWMKIQVLAHRNHDPFWHQVGLMIWQIKGMEDSFHFNVKSNSKELTDRHFLDIKLDPFGI